jgi:hypothetical protein
MKRMTGTEMSLAFTFYRSALTRQQLLRLLIRPISFHISPPNMQRDNLRDFANGLSHPDQTPHNIARKFQVV